MIASRGLKVKQVVGPGGRVTVMANKDGNVVCLTSVFDRGQFVFRLIHRFADFYVNVCSVPLAS